MSADRILSLKMGLNGTPIPVGEENSGGGTELTDNSVTTRMLAVDYHNNMSAFPDNPNVIKWATGYEMNLGTVRAGQDYPNGVLWAFHCEAGKTYLLELLGYSSSKFVKPNPDGAQYTNNSQCAFVVSALGNAKSGSFGSQDNYIASNWRYGLPQSLSPEYATIYDNVSDSYHRATFRCEKDFYMVFPTSTDVSDEQPYLGSEMPTIVEVDAISQEVLDSGSFRLTTTSNSARFLAPYVKAYSGYALESSSIVYDVLKKRWLGFDLSYDMQRMLSVASRDPADYNCNVILIGDSITNAVTNAGLANAWRKYVSTRLNLGEIVLAVSGTGIVKGAPYDFKGNDRESANYDVEMSGFTGIKHWLDSYAGKESTFTFSDTLYTIQFNRTEKLKTVSLAVVALGTNDFEGNDALGSVSSLTDETTFYGAVQKTYSLLHDEYGIPCVLFVAPFKRQNWNVNNSATVSYTIPDMCHALAEIACLNPDMYVLDCLDRWYLNYDDTAIRSKSFIDHVHIKPYAHHLFTVDLAKEIRSILSTKGIV